MNKLVLPGQNISIQRPAGEIDAIWYEKLRALTDVVNAGGSGGMSIGGAITSGTAGSALFVGPTGVLAQTAVPTLAGQVMTWNGTTWVPTAGGGGGMSIGGAVVGGTAPDLLFVGPGPVLAQMANLPTSYLNSGTSATSGTFWRGDGTWASTLVPPPYTPTALGTALRAWYEMDHLVGGAGSSQPSIADNSGNGFNLSQGTVGNQGTLAVADQNGLNTLNFVAANQTQYTMNRTILSGSAAGSLYMVFKAAAFAFNGMMDWGTSGAGNNNWPYSDQHFYIDFGSTAYKTMPIATTNVTAGYVIISIYADTNDWAMYVDGGTGGSSGGTSPLFHTASNTVAWNASNPILGASTGYPGYWGGHIAELYFTNAHQSTLDRQKNEGYLAWKWGLQGNLDPTHPYKSAPPTTGGGSFISIGAGVTGGTPKSVLYVDNGGNLGQDPPHFMFDPATNYLSVGTTSDTGVYYLNGVPGLYQVINAGIANWFEGNAGNLTLSGTGNFGTGDGVLANLTTGSGNMGVGGKAATGVYPTLHWVKTGNSNMAVGSSALSNLGIATDGNQNTAIGDSALIDLGQVGGGSFNVALGQSALNVLGSTTAGAFNANVAIGHTAGNFMATGSSNIFVGDACAQNMTDSASSVFIGTNCFKNVVGAGGQANTVVGSNIGAWTGPVSGVNDIIMLQSGRSYYALDYNYTMPYVWSLSDTHLSGVKPQGLHIYNNQDLGIQNPTNFERGILDWNVTSNVFTIGTPPSSHGGTGQLRETRLYTMGLPGLFVVPNGSGNNWFEDNAGNFTLTGYQNFGTGDGAMASLTTGYQNCAFGPNALGDCTSGDQNMAIGSQALQFITSGAGNVGIGISALRTITTDGGNVGLGSLAFVSSTSVSESVGIGFTVGAGVGTILQGVLIGRNAGIGIPNSNRDIFIGAYAGQAITNNTVDNVFIGGSVGYNITGASRCTILGPWLGPATTINDIISLSAGRNQVMDWNWSKGNTWSMQNGVTPVGHHIYNTYDGANPPVNFERGILDWNVTSNIFSVGTPTGSAGGSGILRDTIFYTAGKPGLYRVANASGDNWFEGNAGNMTVTGAKNFGTGDGSLTALTTGQSNTALGSFALASCTTGSWNMAVGDSAAYFLTTGTQNIAIGQNALIHTTSGSYNTALGRGSLFSSSTGNDNTAIGFGAFTSATGATQATAIGSNAAIGPTSTFNDTFIGAYAAYSMGGAISRNTYLGAGAGYSFANSLNSTVIGTWPGTGASVNGIITISAGNNLQFDWNWIVANRFSFQSATTPVGVHVYNTYDGAVPPTNFERGVLDWNLSSNVFRLASQAGGTGTVRLIAIDGFQKAGAPAAGDLPSGTCALINDTSGGNTWLVYNAAGTIRKVQLV